MEGTSLARRVKYELTPFAVSHCGRIEWRIVDNLWVGKKHKSIESVAATAELEINLQLKLNRRNHSPSSANQVNDVSMRNE